MRSCFRGAIIALLVAAIPATAFADKVLIVSGAEYYLLEIGAGGKPALIQITRVVNLDNPTQPPPKDPPTDPTDPLRAKALHLARFTGDATGAKGLSIVYSLVADQLDAGKLSPANTFDALAAASSATLSSLGTTAKWADWRAAIGDDLTAKAQRGEMTTAAQQSAALRSIAGGLDDYLAGSGILDNIDWLKLIELIMMLIKLIGGFG